MLSYENVHKPTRYREHIDGLRAIAVLGVVLFHFGAAWLPEGVPEERRILNREEDSPSYLSYHAVQALLPSLPMRQGRQIRPPSRQAEMVVPALRISIHQPVSPCGGR